MSKNSPHLMKNNNLHIQEVQQTPNRIKAEKHRHIIVKMLKVKNKEKILQASPRKTTPHI